MPVYEVQLSDGRRAKVEGDREPTEADVLALIGDAPHTDPAWQKERGELLAQQKELREATPAGAIVNPLYDAVSALTPRGIINSPSRMVNTVAGTSIPDIDTSASNIDFKGFFQTPAEMILGNYGRQLFAPDSPVAGVTDAMEETASGLTSGDALLTLPAAANPFGRSLMAFDILRHAPEQMEEARAVVQDPESTPRDVATAFTRPVISTAMGVGLAGHRGGREALPWERVELEALDKPTEIARETPARPVETTAPAVAETPLIPEMDFANLRSPHRAGVEFGLTLKAEDVPMLEKAKSDAYEAARALINSTDPNAFKANFGRGVYLEGVIEGAKKSGPNYEAYLKEKSPEAVPTEKVGSTEPSPGSAVKEGELVGMGAAVPAEFEGTTKSPTSIKNAQVDVERQNRGLPPAIEPARRSFGTVWDEAMAKLDSDPGYADRLINELRENPRALKDSEDATLLQRQIELQNEYDKVNLDMAEAVDAGKTFPNRLEDAAELRVRSAELSDKLLDLYNINKKVGTETGRGLNARKMMAYEDFSLAKMEIERRAVKGGRQLTEAERAEVAELNQKIQETQKAYDDYVSKTDARIAEMEVKRALDEVEREAKKQPTYPPEILSTAERIVRGLEKRADAATIRLKQKLAQFGSGPDYTIILDLAEIGVAKLGRAALDFTGWASAMRTHLGEELSAKVEPFFKEAFETSKAMLEADLLKAKAPDRVKRAVKGTDIASRISDAKETIKERVANGKRNEITGQVQRLARSLVERGVKDRNELIDSVHEILKEIDPKFTRREAMDAISGYGDFKQLTKDEISVTLRDLKGQMQQVGKLEDMQAGKAPEKTGIERRTPSDEERRLIKQVEEAKKKGGYVVTDPATQLRSALQSIKTRLENQIADLEHEIATKTKIVREKSEPPTSPEVEALKARRDELKASRDALFGKRELTDEQRVKIAMAAVEKSIAEYERRIKAGELETPKTPSRTPNTPELLAARAKRDALMEQLQELRDLDPVLQAERRSNALESEKRTLEKTIAEQERRLREGDLAPKGAPVNRPSDPTLEPLKQRRDELTKALAEARKKPEEQKHAEMLQRRLEAMKKAIAAKEAKIAAGDISPSTAKKQNRPLTPELEMAKQRLELLNKQLDELRNPPKTPEQRALQSLKTRLANQIETLQDKLARGDFAKKPKREIAMDAEANRLHFAASKARIAWHEALMKDRLANRNIPEKILGTMAETLNTSRAILTSLDLSAVVRQGGFIALAHPIRAAKSFPAMFKAFRSEAGQHAVNQEILSRKNYPLYNQSKLYLSEHGQKLSQMEEAYMSRWADKIPLVAGSQRAYVTFLNKLRADSFDAMANSLSRGGELTPVEANAIANFINVATGRGNIGMKENALVGLNTVFFAPRYVSSRFQLIAGQPLYRGTPRTRKLVAQEYARYLIGLGVVYGLAQLDGAEVEKDPRSSDFGKLRYGNTRLDPLSGLSQATVLLSRLGTGETKTLGGNIVPIRGEDVPFGSGNSADVMARFLRTKLAPVPSQAVNVLAGKDVVGQPVTAGSTAESLMVPLAFRDIYDAMIEQGVPRGTAFALLSLLGVGMQSYETEKKGEK